MKIFYDTEFIEDGRTIDLISIGMVAADGRTLYLVNRDIDDGPLYGRIRRHEWLMAHVVPQLPLSSYTNVAMAVSGRLVPGGFALDTTDKAVVPLGDIRAQVRTFVRAIPEPQLWAWCGAYDHVVLAQLFGPMVDRPEGIPMWTNDLRQECQRLGDPQMPDHGEAVHHALDDAYWAPRGWRYLAHLELGRRMYREASQLADVLDGVPHGEDDVADRGRDEETS